MNLEFRWELIEFPQPDVSDDDIARSRWFIADDGVIMAEILRYGEYDGYEIVKRLNEWEEQERERNKELQTHFQKRPLGAEGPTGD